MHSFTFCTSLTLQSSAPHLPEPCCSTSTPAIKCPSALACPQSKLLLRPSHCFQLVSAVKSRPQCRGHAPGRRCLLWKKNSASRSSVEVCEPGHDVFLRENQEEHRETASENVSGTDFETHEEVSDQGIRELQKVFAVPVQHIKESLSQVSELPAFPGETTRRRVLGAPMFMSLICAFSWVNEDRARALTSASVDLSKALHHPFILLADV